MRAPGRLTVAGLVSGRPGIECPEQDEGSRETDCSRAGLRAPPPLPSAGAHRPGNHPWGGSAGSLPVEGAHSCLAARGVAQFLGLPGRLSYCCEREILPEVMLEA